MFRATKVFRGFWSPIKNFIRNKPYPSPFVQLLRNLPETQYTCLPNGLVIATEERHSFNACVGLFIDAGSRYESDFQNGITHFFEHIAFKSTCSRTRAVLEAQMSCTAARFRCLTTREMVVYYAECLCEEVPLVADILSDCVFNNAFNSSDIENQKRTVYCEMLEHERNVDNVLEDYLHATAFQGTPLGKSVMGTTENLRGFNEATVGQYLLKHFDPKRTVFAAVGGIKHDHIVQLANAYLCKLQPIKCLDKDLARYTGSEVRYRDDSLPVANVALAVEGVSMCDEDNDVLEVAKNILGGWDRNQSRGVDHAYTIARASSIAHLSDAYKAFNINYKDTGLWGIKFMGPTLLLEDILYIIQNEFMKLCTCVSESEVERGRRETKTELLTRTESCLGTLFEVGRSTLYRGHRVPLHERICAIDRISAVDIKNVCTNVIYDKCPAVAAVGPVEGLPEYTRIRSGMYWLRL